MSDVSEKFQSECAVFLETGPGAAEDYENCSKKHGHNNFINVSDLTLHSLPPTLRTAENLCLIQNQCDRTVKVTVKFVSPDRPETFHNCQAKYPFTELKKSRRVTRCGSGFLIAINTHPITGQVCPCHLCKKSDMPERRFWRITVSTATHVVYDNEEAAATMFECFYDSDDRSSVKTLYGIGLQDNNRSVAYQSDRCTVVCCTHDKHLARRLEKVVAEENKNTPLMGQDATGQLLTGVMVSHPHGLAKKISFGSILNFYCPIDQACKTLLPYNMLGRLERCRLTNTNPNSTPAIQENQARYHPTAAKTPNCTPAVQQNQTKTDPNTTPADHQTLAKNDPTTTKTFNNAVQQTLVKTDPNQNEGSESKSEEEPKTKMSVRHLLKQFPMSIASKKFNISDVVNGKPGKPVSLPPNMTVTLPKGENNLFQCSSCDGWIKFPPGTKLTQENGHSFLCPPEIDFSFAGLGDFYIKSSKLYMVYDIPSCRGSSGATIGLADSGGLFAHSPHFTHTATYKDGTNRSGLSFIVGSTQFHQTHR